MASPVPRLAAALLGALTAAAPARANPLDTEPPRVAHTPVKEAPRGAALRISAAITDDSEIFEPTLYYRPAGTRKYLTASMHHAGSQFSATIPDAMTVTDVEYFIEAYDSNGNGPSRFASDEAPQRVRVSAFTSIPVPGSSKGAQKLDDEVIAQAESEGGSLRIAGYSVAGAGVVALGLGTFFGLASRKLNDDAIREPSAAAARQKESDARSKATLATVSWVAGGVLAAGGVAMVLFAPSASSSPEHAAPEARLFVSPAGASFAMSW